ncbi:hypothetical protein ON010_g5831 [Phytophthora cinnamomi]|nr:hypothetical protein ON010_g5831 [Phytophthora cinnamomi]
MRTSTLAMDDSTAAKMHRPNSPARASCQEDAAVPKMVNTRATVARDGASRQLADVSLYKPRAEPGRISLAEIPAPPRGATAIASGLEGRTVPLRRYLLEPENKFDPIARDMLYQQAIPSRPLVSGTPFCACRAVDLVSAGSMNARLLALLGAAAVAAVSATTTCPVYVQSETASTLTDPITKIVSSTSSSTGSGGTTSSSSGSGGNFSNAGSHDGTHNADVGTSSSSSSTTAGSSGTSTSTTTGSADGSIRYWQMDTATNQFKCRGVMEGHVRGVTRLKTFAVGGAPILASASVDSTIRLWDLATYQCVKVLSAEENGHTDAVMDLEFWVNNNETFLISGGLDCEIIVWGLTPPFQQLFKETQDSQVTALCGTQDAAQAPILLIGMADGTISVKELPSFAYKTTLGANLNQGHQDAVRRITTGPSNTFFSTGNDRKMIAWQITGDAASIQSK